jgi:hypothetical protein
MVGAIGQVMAAVFTAIGFVVVAYQIRKGDKMASADFVLRLENEFQEYHVRTYQKLLPGAPWAPDQTGPSGPSEES